MSDPSDSKKPSIPAWQLAQKPTSPSAPPSEDGESKAEKPTVTPPTSDDEQIAETSCETSRPILLEQAEKFLLDPSIQDASVEQKKAFLESKGVQAEDIARLLEKQGKVDVESQKQEESQPTVILDTSSRPNPTQQEQLQSQPPSQLQPRAPAPPIVTYPEFLTQPTESPPLVTVPRLINTAYIAGGLTATIYGLSKFLIAPLTESLTTARHDFSTHTSAHLETLNTKLSTMVSVDPASATKKGLQSTASSAYADSDSESLDSDPTELFHRDIGVQTTPSLSRRPSLSASETAEILPPTARAAASHTAQLRILASHLSDLERGAEGNTSAAEKLRGELEELASYLNEMKFAGGSGYYGGEGRFVATRQGGGLGRDLAVEGVRSDIRGVKGVLLSARNFPGGRVR